VTYSYVLLTKRCSCKMPVSAVQAVVFGAEQSRVVMRMDSWTLRTCAPLLCVLTPSVSTTRIWSPDHTLTVQPSALCLLAAFPNMFCCTGKRLANTAVSLRPGTDHSKETIAKRKKRTRNAAKISSNADSAVSTQAALDLLDAKDAQAGECNQSCAQLVGLMLKPYLMEFSGQICFHFLPGNYRIMY